MCSILFHGRPVSICQRFVTDVEEKWVRGWLPAQASGRAGRQHGQLGVNHFEQRAPLTSMGEECAEEQFR